MTFAVVPCLPETAPFSPEQRAWLNGFLAGIFSRQPQPSSVSSVAVTGASARPLTILWGSQTGTAERLAKQAAKAATKMGFLPQMTDMSAVELAHLSNAQNLLVITSTYGEGEPPDNARSLHGMLCSASAQADLRTVRYSVCALGDTNYALFCQCGKDFDDALHRLGANRVVPRADCDLDYESAFGLWLEAALKALADGATSVALAAPSESSHARPAPIAEPEGYDRNRPFPAPVLNVRRLSSATSSKEVNHIEFSLAGSGLSYVAGDALGVVPQNCPDLVDDLLRALGCDGEEPVSTRVGERPLRTALLQQVDLNKPTPELLTLLGLGAGDQPLHVIDAVLRTTTRPGPAAFVAALKKLQPRLYSISSSPLANPGHVHLTVGAVRFESGGRVRKGVCSTFLAERAIGAGTVGVFVHANPSFRLPADASLPVIMIGPGTGIAPFRAFLQERAATGAAGRNWLFFGDQHAAKDFLYQDELEGWLRTGTLTRLETAFSRDQAEKLYVQHRMLENARELWSWLESGAHLYVCGDASRMAKDVDAALHQIVVSAGGKTTDEAIAYVQALRAAKRYARDVY